MARASFEESLGQTGLPRTSATNAQLKWVLGRIARKEGSRAEQEDGGGVGEETEATAAMACNLRGVGSSDGRGTGESRLLRRSIRSARVFG